MGSYTQKAAIARCKHDDSQGTVCNCKEVCFSSQAFGTSRFFQPKKQGTRFRFLEPKKSQSKIIKQLNLGPYCLKVRELKRWSYLTWSFTPTSSLHRRHFLASIRETFQSSGKESEINCGPKSIQFTHQHINLLPAFAAWRNHRFHVSAMKHLRRCALALLVALPMCLAHSEDVPCPSHPDVSKYVNDIYDNIW